MSTFSKATSALFALLVVAGTSSCGSSLKDQWDDRSKFPNCGSVEVGQGEEVTTTSHSEVTCMANALDSGTGAELLVESPTVEGDMIRSHYRLHPDGQVELFLDSSDDPHAGADWELIECVSPAWLPGVTCPVDGPDADV